MEMKVLNRMENYSECEADFMGLVQTLRIWKNNTLEIKFNDNFARGNGFKDREDMLDKNKGMRETLLQACGEIPEWINIGDDGSFRVKIIMSNENYN